MLFILSLTCLCCQTGGVTESGVTFDGCMRIFGGGESLSMDCTSARISWMDDQV